MKKLSAAEKIKIWKEIFAEADRDHIQGRKEFPRLAKAFDIITVLLFVALFVSLIVWGFQVRAEHKAEAVAFAEQQQLIAEETARAQEQEALRLAQQAEERERREQETILLAKMLSGINGFVENYGYSEGDLRTYLECVINRAINTQNGFPNNLIDVILQENQWVGFSETNQVISRYYKIAQSVVNDYYNSVPRPCSADFCWAELNRDGIWLKNEYSDSRYVRTWRYSA